MRALGYYMALPVIYGISILPFPALYLLSDVMEILVFGLARYRLGVIRENLRNSFPEKTDAERMRIEREFRGWFCDLVLETLKTLTISPKELDKRVSVVGTDVLNAYFEKDASIILVMGHWGNWELGGARFSQLPFHKLNVIYHPLQNRYFERLIVRMRPRLGNGLYPMKDTMRCMLRDRHELTATAFIADQTPSPEHAYWTTFLHQATPVFRGTETIARKMALPIVYVGIDRLKRGRYAMRFELLEGEPAKTAEGVISEKHTRRLETDIRRHPAIWLWTHRRWKHPPPVNIQAHGA